MLVLTRKAGEKIVIDGNIEITILKVKGNTVSIGIKAPNSVKIIRAELILDPPTEPEGAAA